MGEIRNVYKILTVKKLRSKHLEDPRRRWEDNIYVVVLFRMGARSRLL